MDRATSENGGRGNIFVNGGVCCWSAGAEEVCWIVDSCRNDCTESVTGSAPTCYQSTCSLNSDTVYGLVITGLVLFLVWFVYCCRTGKGRCGLCPKKGVPDPYHETKKERSAREAREQRQAQRGVGRYGANDDSDDEALLPSNAL